jgi:chromosome segregation ATPase
MLDFIKDDEMSFSPIYKNFQNLLAENSGVFKLFKKTKNPGMYQAVWQARQAEVDTYRERLKQVEHKLVHLSDHAATENISMHRRIKDLQAILLGKGETIDDLKKQKKRLEETLTQLQKDLLVSRQDNEQLDIVKRSYERKSLGQEGEIKKLREQMKTTNQELSIAHQALVKLDCEHTELYRDHEELTLENEKLHDDLEKSRHYAKEFRRINGRMENELHRVNHELEKVQSLM